MHVLVGCKNMSRLSFFFSFKGAFINTLVGGWAKWRGAKSFELPEGGGPKSFP